MSTEVVIIPKNRQVLVELLERDEVKEESPIIIDAEDDLQDVFVPFKILGWADNCERKWERGSIIFAETRMIDVIQFDGVEYSFVLENYILCEVGLT